MYTFKPPTVEEGPAGFGILFWRYRLPRANSILVNGSVVTSIRTPAVQDTQSADYCYLGGHEYIIPSQNITFFTQRAMALTSQLLRSIEWLIQADITSMLSMAQLLI